MSQNGQTHVKCIGPFWDILHERVNHRFNHATKFSHTTKGSAQHRHFDEDAENVFSREKLYTFN